MNDLISKQVAIRLADILIDDLPDDEQMADCVMAHNDGILEYQTALSQLPSVQPEKHTEEREEREERTETHGVCLDAISRQQATCEYCHEDSDGYVLSIEKNGHVYIQNGKLALRANGWWGECSINYCPMCGRKLRGETHNGQSKN